jgi:catechol 1,2-dioxygenase
MKGKEYLTSLVSNRMYPHVLQITPKANICRLVDEIAHKLLTEGANPTSSSILGPFWSPNAPFRPLGGNIIQDPAPGGHPALMHGKVTDLLTGKGIPGAVVDIWQASSNGKYDFQDPENQSDNNLRGKFKCDENGEYNFYYLKPTAY